MAMRTVTMVLAGVLVAGALMLTSVVGAAASEGGIEVSNIGAGEFREHAIVSMDTTQEPERASKPACYLTYQLSR